MDENTENPVVEETPGSPPVEVLSDEYKQSVADITKIAKSLDSTAEKVAKTLEVQKSMQEDRKKNRQIVPAAERDLKTIGDVMRRKTYGEQEVADMHELNDRAIAARIVKAVRNGEVTPGQKLNVADLPRTGWDGIDEIKEIRSIHSKAAGGFWDTGTATSVAEWLPTGFSRTAEQFYTVDLDLPPIFRQVDIPKGVGPFSTPIKSSRGHAVIEAQQTAASGAIVNTAIFSQALSDTVDFTPVKHANGHAVSVEGNEDLAINAMAEAQMDTPNTLRWGITSALINGATANDADLDDLPATSGLYSAAGYSNAAGDNGLRLHCVINSYTTGVAGAMDSDDVLAGRKEMAKYGARSDEVAFITSPVGYLGMLADTDVKTVDKFGPKATVLTGQLAAAGGVPILMTSEFPEDMDADGINAGTGATTGAIIVNHRRWYFAKKRNIETTIIPQPGMDIINVISRMRSHFSVAITTEHSAHYFINVS